MNRSGFASRLLRSVWLTAVLLACAPATALAAISCDFSVSSITVYYDSASSAAVPATGTININCTRATGDPASRWLRFSNVGSLYCSGSQARALLSGTNYLNYDLATTNAFSTPWDCGSTATTAPVQVSFGTGNAASASTNFYFRVLAGQSLALGTYSDTVTVQGQINNNANNSGGSYSNLASTRTFPVSVIVPNTCVISSPPGTISLAYTSFQTTAATASTSFAVRCAAGAPYTMALDSTSGTLLGLNYSLSLSSTSNNGNGAPQSTTITGSIAANQAGTCASTGTCTASKTHSLTVTY